MRCCFLWYPTLHPRPILVDEAHDVCLRRAVSRYQMTIPPLPEVLDRDPEDCLTGRGLRHQPHDPTRSERHMSGTAHYHPRGKQASPATRWFQASQRATLAFEDQRDFAEHTRGLIATPEFTQIMADAGNFAWDMGRYEFLFEGKEFDSIHPSLQR